MAPASRASARSAGRRTRSGRRPGRPATRRRSGGSPPGRPSTGIESPSARRRGGAPRRAGPPRRRRRPFRRRSTFGQPSSSRSRPERTTRWSSAMRTRIARRRGAVHQPTVWSRERDDGAARIAPADVDAPPASRARSRSTVRPRWPSSGARRWRSRAIPTPSSVIRQIVVRHRRPRPGWRRWSRALCLTTLRNASWATR